MPFLFYKEFRKAAHVSKAFVLCKLRWRRKAESVFMDDLCGYSEY